MQRNSAAAAGLRLTATPPARRALVAAVEHVGDVVDLLAGVGAGADVLDVAAGSGNAAIPAAQRGAHEPLERL